MLNSDAPYPQAAPSGVDAPTVTPGAREDTKTLGVYVKTNPFTGELGLQRNDRIDLEVWAGRVTAGYSFANVAWSPNVTLGDRSFSGDDPNTPKLERFDPLCYRGSPSAWATGSKSASTFINSKVNALTLAVRVQRAPQDTLTLRFAHIRANELNSPVQFGQATRVCGIAVSKTAHFGDRIRVIRSVVQQVSHRTWHVQFPSAGRRRQRFSPFATRPRRPEARFPSCSNCLRSAPTAGL